MSRIPRPLARRIDRLARHAHAFHRFAHHPLCAAYQGEILRFGRFRVCRGCFFSGLGGTLGGLAGSLLPSVPMGHLCIGFALGILGAVALVVLPRVRSLGKGVTRFLPFLVASILLVQGLRGLNAVGFALVGSVLAAMGLALVLYRRRGPWRGPCGTCPELERRPCAGFRLQVRRERAFQRLAGRMLAE